MNRPILSVIMPVFNEIHLFRMIFEKVKAVPVQKEIIVIDDGSQDGTRELLKTIESEKHERVKILFQEKNQGKTAAIRRGIQEAQGEITIIQDADLEYEPNDYPALIQPILDGKTDVVYGSRYLKKNFTPFNRLHTMVNQMLTLLSNLFTGQKLTDMETCYKVFKTSVIKNIRIESHRFDFEPEVTAKISHMGINIVEIPISYYGRKYEEGKKIGWRDGISAVVTIIRCYFKR